MSTNQAIISPRIAALQEDIRAGKAGALEEFWREATLRAGPLIETVDADNQLALVTFLWRDADSKAHPALICSLTFPAETDAMMQIPKTDVWFRTYQAPRNILDTYQFAVGDSNLLDPFNPRVQVFPDDEENNLTGWKSSILELPDARPHPWSNPVAGTPTGEIALHRFQSKVLGSKRRVWIYKPSNYGLQNEPYRLLMVFDGWFYLHLIPTPTILDNLVAANRISPMVAVLIGSTFDKTRDRDLGCYPPYFEFVTTELIPWVRDTCHVTTNPHETVVAGASRGGLAAAFAGLRFPGMFGNILSNSGSFGWKPDNETEYEWISRQYAESPRRDLQFYLDAGSYELGTQRADAPSILVSNRHLRDVLKAKGYRVHYQEFSGGHNPTNWRGTFADGLLALIRNGQSQSEKNSRNR